MQKVLFLCTGNSCRSQMAEAITNARIGEKWQAFSAGTEPAGYIHPKALQILSEIDIHHEGVSKPIDQLKDLEFDLVITVCDDAAENCPVWLGRVTRHRISFPDPAKVTGDEEVVLSAFRDVRGAIADQVIKFLSSYTKDGKIPRRN